MKIQSLNAIPGSVF